MTRRREIRWDNTALVWVIVWSTLCMIIRVITFSKLKLKILCSDWRSQSSSLQFFCVNTVSTPFTVLRPQRGWGLWRGRIRAFVLRHRRKRSAQQESWHNGEILAPARPDAANERATSHGLSILTTTSSRLKEVTKYLTVASPQVRTRSLLRHSKAGIKPCLKLLLRT